MATENDDTGAARLRARLEKLLDRQREIEAEARAAQEAAYELRSACMMIGSQIAEICREFDIAVEFDDYSSGDDGLTLIEVFHAEDAHYVLEAAADWADQRADDLAKILTDPAMTEDDLKRALIRTYGLDENWELRARRADALWDPSKSPPDPEPRGPVVDMRRKRRT
jgi:hypothetical protein